MFSALGKRVLKEELKEEEESDTDLSVSVGLGTIDELSEFGARIQNLRRQKNLSVTELAKRAGLSRQAVYSALEMGKDDMQMPKVTTLMALANALEVHPYWLVEGLFANVAIPAKLATQMEGERAGFVDDVTYPDGILAAPGTRFTKIWRFQNLGPTAWEGCHLVCWDDEVTVTSKRTKKIIHVAKSIVPDTRRVPIPTTPPGHTVEIAVNFTAPTSAGTCVSYWIGVDASEHPVFGEEGGIAVVVKVTTLSNTIAFSPNLR